MKFVYVDESGTKNQDSVFVMCGLMVDARRLRKTTEEFEQLLTPILERFSTRFNEFKTSKFIQGKGVWKTITQIKRQQFLKEICELVIHKGVKVVGLALSFSALKKALSEDTPPLSKPSPWQISAMFLASLVQKKMQGEKNNKGHTVFIMDDNSREMQPFSNELYARNKWFDDLYEKRGNGRNKGWKCRNPKDRFNQIINTAFAIKSEHATLIQVADAVCYIYRRHLELTSTQEAWNGEKEFYQELFELLELNRLKLGHCPPDRPCVEFYKAVKHNEWKL